jgi:hypothetical protein
MQKLKDAAENIKRLSVMFKGLVEVAEEVDKVAALEDHSKALELKRDQMLSAIHAMDEQKAAAAEYCSAADKYGKEVIEQANKDSAAIAESTISKAQAIIEEAKGQAVLAAAEAKGEEMRAKEEFAKAQVDLDQLKLMVADESAKLEAIQNQLAAIKGAI